MAPGRDIPEPKGAVRRAIRRVLQNPSPISPDFLKSEDPRGIVNSSWEFKRCHNAAT